MNKGYFQNLLWSEGAVFLPSASNSNIINTCGMSIRQLFFPENWTTCDISYQVSPDGINFYTLFNIDGSALAVTTSAGMALPLVPYLYDSSPYIILSRSVTQVSESIVGIGMMPIYQIDR